jgi:hypothetical protein
MTTGHMPINHHRMNQPPKAIFAAVTGAAMDSHPHAMKNLFDLICGLTCGTEPGTAGQRAEQYGQTLQRLHAALTEEETVLQQQELPALAADLEKLAAFFSILSHSPEVVQLIEAAYLKHFNGRLTPEQIAQYAVHYGLKAA